MGPTEIKGCTLKHVGHSKNSREYRLHHYVLSHVVLLSLLSALFLQFFDIKPVMAVGEPTVTWATDNNSTFSGYATINATASADSSGTANIKKWCITRNGSPLTTNWSSWSPNYSRLSDSSFSPATGCWASSTNLTSGSLRFDTTAWANGSHTFQITVTDTSDRTATSTVLTINNTNPGPSVTWATDNNLTFSGYATINATASADSSGTANIKKWCITRNGSPLTTNWSSWSPNYSRLSDSSFSPATGCWASSTNLTSGSLRFDTTAWANGSHTFQITVTDTSDRTATSTVLTIQTQNALSKSTATTIAQKKRTKTTIVCVKGRAIKRVTAFSPKCPRGYSKRATTKPKPSPTTTSAPKAKNTSSTCITVRNSYNRASRTSDPRVIREEVLRIADLFYRIRWGMTADSMLIQLNNGMGFVAVMVMMNYIRAYNCA